MALPNFSQMAFDWLAQVTADKNAGFFISYIPHLINPFAGRAEEIFVIHFFFPLERARLDAL